MSATRSDLLFLMPAKTRDEYLNSVSEQQCKSRFQRASWPRRIARFIAYAAGEAAVYVGMLTGLATALVLGLGMGVQIKLSLLIGLGVAVGVAIGWVYAFEKIEQHI